MVLGHLSDEPRQARGGRRKTLQRELELTCYQATLEFDEGFFGAPSEGGRRGRGTVKTSVMTGLSMNTRGRPGYIHMQALDAVNGDTVKKFAEKNIQPYSMVNTDGLNIYNVLDEPDYDHLAAILTRCRIPTT